MEKINLIIVAVLVILIIIYLFESKFHKSADDKFIFYKELNNGYTTLIKLLYHDHDDNYLNEIIKRIIVKRADGRYVSMGAHGEYAVNTLSFSLDSFYDLMKKTERQKINLMLELNDTLTLESLNHFLKSTLGNTISTNSFLQTDLDEAKGDVTCKKILLTYQKALNQELIQLGLLHDGFGSYYLLVFNTNQEKAIEKSINIIGLEYENLSLENNFMFKDTTKDNFIPTPSCNRQKA